MRAEIVVGAVGQFDVVVGDRVVASKASPGIIGWLTGRRGFPEASDVVEAVRLAIA